MLTGFAELASGCRLMNDFGRVTGAVLHYRVRNIHLFVLWVPYSILPEQNHILIIRAPVVDSIDFGLCGYSTKN